MNHQQIELPPPEDRLLRITDVLARIPMARATWWKGVKDGRYPAGIKLGPKMTCWRASDINALISKL